MELTYREGSLFDLNKEDYLYVHCISMDFAMRVGVAKQIEYRYQIRTKLKAIAKQNPTYFQEFKFGFCVTVDNICNLITKRYYYNKPTLVTMKEALFALKNKIVKDNIKQIAMPKIGCGYDRLYWEDVESLIKEVFKDIDVTIIICCI